MTTFVNGDSNILYIKLDDVFYPIGCLDGNSFSESADEIDTTTSDNAGWKTTLPTNQGFEISFSGLLTSSAVQSGVVTFYDLMDLKRNRTLIEWQIGNTKDYDYGQAYINDLSEDSPAGELITFSGSLKGFGRPKNLLKEIYDNWKTSVESESAGSVSSRKCVLTQIYNLI